MWVPLSTVCLPAWPHVVMSLVVSLRLVLIGVVPIQPDSLAPPPLSGYPNSAQTEGIGAAHKVWKAWEAV